jgi:DNA-binding NtrC family response regulator
VSDGEINADISILYVEDDPPSGQLVQSVAESIGYRIEVVGTGKEFLAALAAKKPNLLLVDLHLPDASGLDLLAQARLGAPDTQVIVVTASNSIDDAITALKGGAADYLTKPVEVQRLIVSLNSAAKILRQQQDLSKLRTEIKNTYKLEHIIGTSAGMEEVRKLIRHAGRTDSTVLIVGESGTGKELVAKALHYASRRSAKPFVDVNCAAMTETLIESELFGHEKGSFTSAIARRRGKFEQAHGGSFFLDEIGDMPLATQAKMLRVLQERSFQRVGGEEKIDVDVRVICATNQDLGASVKAGTFRLDLFYRINPLMIEVPPLRERAEDIPKLAKHFLAKANGNAKNRVRGISEAAMTMFQSHSWPGNVRELQNAIERAIIVCEEDEIQPSHLPPAISRRAPSRSARIAAADLVSGNLLDALEHYERSIILNELQKNDWNKTRAARSLGVTRRILSYKIQNLGLEKSASGPRDS